MIDDIADKVSTAVSATSGGIRSKHEGILLAGNADHIEDKMKEIKEEETK